METFGLNTVLLHNDTAASNNLSGVTLTVDLAKTSPGSENLSISDLDEVNFVLGAEGLNELDVLGLSAGLDENAQMSLALVEGLGALAETASETVVNESVLQDLLLANSGQLQVPSKDIAISRTWRASSTESLPLGASAETSTSAATSTGMSSPASDILGSK